MDFKVGDKVKAKKLLYPGTMPVPKGMLGTVERIMDGRRWPLHIRFAAQNILSPCTVDEVEKA